jgi:leucyl aminopeptidase
MPDGAASRPGDVVRSLSGQTIEIVNTDCEGRMVLADALWHAHATFDPHVMVDVATLTEGVCVALGGDHGGLFANDEALACALLAARASSGEPLWRLPLASDLKRRQAEIADLRQDWNGPGATVAATFLEAFTGGRPWAHLDIAGVAWRDDNDDPRLGSGPTAFGLRLLDAWVRASEANPHWR